MYGQYTGSPLCRSFLLWFFLLWCGLSPQTGPSGDTSCSGLPSSDLGVPSPVSLLFVPSSSVCGSAGAGWDRLCLAQGSPWPTPSTGHPCSTLPCAPSTMTSFSFCFYSSLKTTVCHLGIVKKLRFHEDDLFSGTYPVAVVLQNPCICDLDFCCIMLLLRLR